MSQALNLYLEKACFFMIAAQLLFHFLPSKKYEKYMGMLTGFICMTILIIPVGNLIFHKQDWMDMAQIEEFEEKLQKVMTAQEIMLEKEKYQSISYQLEQMYSGKEQIKEKLEPVVNAYGYTVEAVTYEMEEEEKLCIILSQQEETNKPIAVEKITWDEQEPKTVPQELKESIAKELMIDEEYIRIK